MSRLPVVALAMASCIGGGCASSTAANPAPVVLTVQLGLYGGPYVPGRGMADVDVPQPDAPITVTNLAGRIRTGHTDREGVATFDVRPGRYVVDSPSCGPGPHRITVAPGRLTRVDLHCDIP